MWTYVLLWIGLSQFISTASGFSLGQTLGKLHNIFSGVNLCPALDCWPIETSLTCDFADRYQKSMVILGMKCPGCPACRDDAYFQEITKELQHQVQKSLLKLQDEKQIMNDNKASIEAVRLLLDEHTQSSTTDVALSQAQWISVQELLKTNLQEMDRYLANTALVKATRYLEENEQELEQILNYGQFLEKRLDINTHGFYENRWTHPNIDYYADLPAYENHRYNELLVDLVLDKLSLVTQRLQSIEDVMSKMQIHASNVTSMSSQQLSDMNVTAPLLLRRLYQLIESSQGAVQVYLQTDLNGIHMTTTSISNILLEATEQRGKRVNNTNQQESGSEMSFYSRMIGGP